MQPGKVISRFPVKRGESAANHDFPVILKGDSAHKSIGAGSEIDGWVNGTIGIQAHNPVALQPVEGGKVASQHQFSIQLQNNSKNGPVRSQTRIEGCIQSAVLIQARHIPPVHAADGGEQAADHHFVILLHRQSADGSVGAQSGVERAIQTAVGV